MRFRLGGEKQLTRMLNAFKPHIYFSSQTMNKQRTMDNLNHDQSYFKPEYQILQKHALIGPVTSITLDSVTSVNNNGEKINVELCIFARGPYINIVPLHLKNITTNKALFTQSSDKEKCFSHIAFHSNFEQESGTVHGLQKVGNVSNDRYSLWAIHGGKNLSFVLIDAEILIIESLKDTSSRDCIVTKDLQFHDGKYQKLQCIKPYLSMTDWVWDVRAISVSFSIGNDDDSCLNTQILSAIGMAQNVVEIWSFTSHESGKFDMGLEPVKLRKIICERRCITYSLSFYGWKNDGSYQTSIDNLDLAVAVGTVSNEILIWSAVNGNDCEQLHKDLIKCKSANSGDISSNNLTKRKVNHALNGHLGVIFSVKFGKRGSYIASTSDDRTIRLWKRNCELNEINNDLVSPFEKSSDVQMITNESYVYILIWSAFGHAGRVWDSDFISIPTQHQSEEAVISSGEDGTLKIWKIKDGVLMSSLNGHGCQNIWKVRSRIAATAYDECLTYTVSGANDGSVNIWDLSTQLIQQTSSSSKFILPNLHRQVCAFCFYTSDESDKLLVATRDGIVATYDPMTHNWEQHGRWLQIQDQHNDLKPEHGSCILPHPNHPIALMGTTKGHIILFSISNPCENKIDSSARKYLSIQSICWLDTSNFLSFHVKGIVVWWEINDPTITLGTAENILKVKAVLNMNIAGIKIGVPMCHHHDAKRRLIFIGDSRGNIAMFSADRGNHPVTDQKQVEPMDLLVYVHKKEHVTCIVASKDGRGILSAGNDGRLHETTIFQNESIFKMQRSLSTPISNLTGVSYLWWSDSKTLIAGGYIGNQFVITDVASNRQLLNIDSGGRNRRMALTTELKTTVAICVANKKSPFEILLYSSPSQKSQVSTAIPSDFTIPFHGEAIYDTAICTLQGKLMILSGSNDCSVKLSTVKESNIYLLKELPPHESCIRALCFSHHEDSLSSLIVVCGGKLITTFYRLEKHDDDTVSIHYLCSSKLSIKKSIDHRMNAVKAMPMPKESNISQSHLIVAGDSDGGLHLTIVSEELDQSRKVCSRLLDEDSRPILAIDIIRLSNEFILVFAGTTAGDINVWLLTQNRDGEIESSSGPVVTLKAHTMGTNCVKASIFGEYSTDNLSVVEVLILSGGDDQALSSNLLSVSLLLSPDEAQVKIDSLVSFTKKEACASAIKGICLVGNQSSGFRVYTTGYDQRVAMWSILIDKIDSSYRMTLHLLTSAPVDIKDVNTIAGCTICCQNDMNTKEYIVAGGEGLEILTFDNCIWDTASALKKCDRLLITCGAGFGADSGLATYESMPDEYRSLCNPMRLVDSLESYQQFWLKFAFEYQIASPHLGYTVLENLCVGGKLKHLNHDGNSSSSLSPWWIYSSNVDGHFGLFDCFKNTICEIHGRASEFRCAHGSGFNNAVKRCGNTWEKWNNHCSGYESNEVCKNSRVDVASLKNKSAPLLCPECKLELRPNVLMFHDTDENILRDIDESRQKYQQWEALVEERVVHNGERLVVLELGAGKNVTAVRDESEEVFRDIVERLQQSNSKGHVTLIRINPKDLSSDLKQSKSSNDFSVIQIPQKAAHALLSIQQALG